MPTSGVMLRGFSVIALLALYAGEANAAGSGNATSNQNVERINLGAPGSIFCPPVSVLPLTGRITVFEEDAESIIYRASIDSAIISCATEEAGLPKSADVSFSGIAESNKAEIITGELPVFLTVLYQQRVVYQKQVEDLAVVFTPEMNKIAYKGKFEDVAIPDVARSAREELRFLIGFQLDEQQLRHNRLTAATP